MSAFEENGLYKTGSVWGIILILMYIAAAATLIGFAVFFKKKLGLASPPEYGLATAGNRRWALIIALVMTLAMVGGSVMLLLTADEERFPDMLRVLALLGIFAAAGFMGLAASSGKPSPKGSALEAGLCLAAALPVAFCCFWLVVSYRQDAATAVVWRYGPEISAIACSLLAFYYLAGHAFGRPRAYTAMFFCACGAFLCFTALPDSRLMALQLLLAGSALMQLFFLASLAANLRRAPEAVPREAEEEPDAPPAQPPEEFGTLDDALRAEREDEEFADSFVEYDPGEPRQKNR